MVLFHRLITAASCIVSLVVLVISAYVIMFLYSFNAYPMGVWFFVPWGFGGLGASGLIGSFGDPANRTPEQLRLYVVLLILGVVGAVLFTVLLVLSWAPLLAGMTLPALLLFGLLFPTLPIIAAATGIFRLGSVWKERPLQDRRKLWRPLTVALSFPFLLVALRFGAQEAVMLWFGHDLTDRARMSAERLADGERYCIIAPDGGVISSFETLEPRSILIDAFAKRYGFRGMNQVPVSPHFGIVTNDQAYWWSFRQGRFVSLPGYSGNESASRRCVDSQQQVRSMAAADNASRGGVYV